MSLPPSKAVPHTKCRPLTSTGELTFKRARRSSEVDETLAVCQCWRILRSLLVATTDRPRPRLPDSLQQTKIKNNLDALRTVLDENGFRTSTVMSPRPGLSLYKDSFRLKCEKGSQGPPKNSIYDNQRNLAREFLIVMFGLYPHQETLERLYTSSFKMVFSLLLFCDRLREACPDALQDTEVQKLVDQAETECRLLGTSSLDSISEQIYAASRKVPEKIARLIQTAVQSDPRLRVEQLQHEHERILCCYSTVSNVHMQLFTQYYDLVIKDVYFKDSHIEKYQRITIYLYEPDVDLLAPPKFTFLPSLYTALTRGAEAVSELMVDTFWTQLLRQGYFCATEIQTLLAPSLNHYFLSGVTRDSTVPIQLNAHFTPTFPLCFYLHGKAGVGKSSLAHAFAPALNATVEQYADPEIVVRFVKQNLNKPMDTLRLELELRPNNNDLSVMSIIRGRRMTMRQSKPGLVVVNLEEMSRDDANADPNQLATAQLISQRFSGRTGDCQGDAGIPRNSSRRGISEEATIIPLFTSNYVLGVSSYQALSKLHMFQNLVCVEMIAVSGEDRVRFANSYFLQCLQDRLPQFILGNCTLCLDIPLGIGDTRPLVRHLRMLAFYTCSTLAITSQLLHIHVSIVKKSDSYKISANGIQSMELKIGSMGNIIPSKQRTFDPRTMLAIEKLRSRQLGAVGASVPLNLEELSIIFDFWLAKTLAPAVILSKDRSLIKSIFASTKKIVDVRCIEHVNSSEYKMMKSLYDPSDTPNLRDDILQFGPESLVSVELHCETVDAQLCIREIIEDTPSMTAFSTEKSALHKSGLLFLVYIHEEITPELRSRASLIV